MHHRHRFLSLFINQCSNDEKIDERKESRVLFRKAESAGQSEARLGGRDGSESAIAFPSAAGVCRLPVG
jgi:hypothetical protein